MLGRRGLVAVSAVLLGAGAVFWLTRSRESEAPPPAPAATAALPVRGDGGACAWSVTRAELETSLRLGTAFLVAHQRDEGNFDYQYDWKAKRYAHDDNDVRQAGALWGLALLAEADTPARADPKLRPALERGLRFFDDHAGTTSNGGRYPIYPFPTDEGEKAGRGGIGTAALVALSAIDYVRGLPREIDAGTSALWRQRANEYVAYLVSARDGQGLWHGKYHYDGGAPFAAHSPYSDGEALLALVKAMKYLGRDDLAPLVKESAAAGHRVDIEEALAKEPDSDTTKGFYQWSSMAFYELATSKWGGDAPYGEWLLSLADWMLEVHHVLDKPRNTGYAYEGLVSAYAWAKQIADPRASTYACAIHRGLGALLAWQVGHPRASALGPSDDPKALGGVQNHKTEPDLRIDVAQHQMHATELALRHLFAGTP